MQHGSGHCAQEEHRRLIRAYNELAIRVRG
jgi:hypothetical protein